MEGACPSSVITGSKAERHLSLKVCAAPLENGRHAHSLSAFQCSTSMRSGAPDSRQPPISAEQRGS